MFNNLWKETESLREEQFRLQDDYINTVKEINIFYGDIITEDTMIQRSSHVELARKIAKSEWIDREGLEPAYAVTENNYIDAAINMLQKNIEYLEATNMDSSFEIRHIFVITKAIIVASIVAITSLLPLALLVGALTYLYLAKQEVIFQKENLPSKKLTSNMIKVQQLEIDELILFKNNL
jgi:hypothetical protein